MKSFFFFVTIFSALSAYAQNLPPSECPAPGVLLSRDYAGQTAEDVAAAYQREGTMDIGTSAEYAGNLKSRVYKVFTERVCVARVFNYQQNVCVEVNPDLALGRGNATFAAFFDLNVSLLKRAELFARSVKYQGAATPAQRLALANEVVKHLTRLASTQGLPKSWDALTALLSKIVAEGFLTQADFDDLTKVNGAINRRELGFEPLPNVQATEGRGNGKLQRIFDLSLTQQHRAAIIRTTLEGVTADLAMNLAKTAIEFAQVSGIPQTWNQFLLMLKDAVAKNAITQADYLLITETLELQNRQNLGFELSFVTCRTENRQHRYNAIEANQVNQFDYEVLKNFRLTIVNAPLLKDEAETFRVSFNGLAGLSVSASQEFNSYTVETSAGAGGLELVKLTGVRKRVKPKNTLKTQVLHQGKVVNVNLQNTNFNALIGGKVVADVHFYEKVAIVSDKKLGERTFDVVGGDVNAFTPNVQMIKPSRPAYVRVFMRIIGSPYYSEEQTGYFEVKE